MPKMPYNVDTDMTVHGDLITTENVSVRGTITLSETDLVFIDSENNYPSDGTGVKWLINNTVSKLYVKQNEPASDIKAILEVNDSNVLEISENGSVKINDSYTLPNTSGSEGQVLRYGDSVVTWSNSIASTISDEAPVDPINGDLWFDSGSTFRLYVYSSSAGTWIDSNPNDAVDVEISESVPSNPLDGDLWFDSGSTFRLYVYVGSADTWIDASPNDSPSVTISVTSPSSPLDGELWYDIGGSYRLFVYSSTAQTWIDASPNDVIDSDSVGGIYTSMVNDGAIASVEHFQFGDPTEVTNAVDTPMKTPVGTSKGIMFPTKGEVTSIIANIDVTSAVASEVASFKMLLNDSDIGVTINVDCSSVGMSSNQIDVTDSSFAVGDVIGFTLSHSNPSISTSEHFLMISTNKYRK